MIAESTHIPRPRKTTDITLSVLFLSQKTYKEGDLLLSYSAFTHPDNDHSDATSY